MTRTAIIVAGLATAAIAACGGAPGEPSASRGEEVTSCPGGSTVEGIDVSKYDGTIDWSAVLASGRAFAFIRVSDGLTHFDPTFDTNWANAAAAGVFRGVYQFFRPGEDATAQADLLLSHLGNLGPGDLPPVLDVEVTDGVSGSAIRAGVDAWSAHVRQATGRQPIVYTAPGFWASVGGGPEDDTLWVANWGVSCPKLASSWSSWKFWQYSDTGKVPGITGDVDLDRFDGTLADLTAYAGGSGGGGDAGVTGNDAGAPDTGVAETATPEAAAEASGGGGTSCSTDGDCNPGSDGSGMICVSQTCVPGCNADWECPGSTTCVGGQCR
ncbi:MAG TPA: GH25 family lysozyme [Polyangiaceae bacterium]|jgi:lysozyme